MRHIKSFRLSFYVDVYEDEVDDPDDDISWEEHASTCLWSSMSSEDLANQVEVTLINEWNEETDDDQAPE